MWRADYLMERSSGNVGTRGQRDCETESLNERHRE
jgi:hypothetical protein